jgi:hypothetical protein
MTTIKMELSGDGSLKAPREEIKQCDGNLNGDLSWMAISEHLEKDSNNVMAIQMELPGGWQFEQCDGA